MTKGDNYKAWNINEKDFPKNGSIEDKIKFILQYGILAPSTHNTQPWQFDIKGNILNIKPNWNYKLPQGDPSSRNIFISLGCCLQNIECAANHFKLKTNLNYLNKEISNTKVIVEFHPLNTSNKELDSLFPYLTKRYSNKLQYSDKKIEKNSLSKLNKININNAFSTVTTESTLINVTADLQYRALVNLSNNKLFSKELAYWLRPNNTKTYDGMPGFVAGLNQMASLTGRILIKNFPKILILLAKKDKQLLIKSPAVGIITTNDSSIGSWIDVGRTYERIALTSFSLNIHCTPMHAVVEDKKLCNKLKESFQFSDKQVQMFFRLGYANNKPYHTPRRTINSFINNEDTESQLINSTKLPIKVNQMKIGNYNINYAVVGSGKPLILIHGGNLGWGQWYVNLPSFANHYQVYAIDLLGGGRSTKIEYSKLNLEQDLIKVVEKFITQLNIKNPHIIGSSIGGWIALKIALNKLTTGKLVLADTIGFGSYMSPFERIIGIYPLAKFISKTVLKPVRSNKKIEEFLRSVFYKKNIPLSKEFLDYFYDTMSTSHNLLFISRLASFFGVRKEFLLGKSLAKIENKVLVIWGEEDKLMPFKYSNKNIQLIPKVTIKIIKKAGHFPSLEKPTEFNNIVTNFLRS